MSPVDELCAVVSDRFGLKARPGWQRQLDHAIPSLALRFRVSPGGLLGLAVQDPELLHEVAGLLTVGETHFFRHPEHFSALSALVAERRVSLGRARDIRIWSAGCASGEEPYSVAMALDQHLGRAALQGISVLATDLDPTALEKARTARYTAWSFRGVDPQILGRYFTPETGGGALLSDTGITSAVSFTRAGIAEQAAALPPQSIDAVLFRNVAIYLAPEALQRAFEAFHRVLAPDGLLIVSPSDPRPPVALFRRAPYDDQTLTLLQPANAPTAGNATAQQTRGARAARPTQPIPSTVPPPRRARTGRAQPRAPLPSGAPSGAPNQHAAPAGHDTIATRNPGGPDDLTQAGPVRARAMELAAAGQHAVAIELMTALVDRWPCAEYLLLQLGQLLLDASRPAAATAILRRAVYLRPGAPIARFWYALALLADGQRGLARAQLEDAERQIRALDRGALLEDGETRAQELLDAVHSTLGELS